MMRPENMSDHELLIAVFCNSDIDSITRELAVRYESATTDIEDVCSEVHSQEDKITDLEDVVQDLSDEVLRLEKRLRSVSGKNIIELVKRAKAGVASLNILLGDD